MGLEFFVLLEFQGNVFCFRDARTLQAKQLGLDRSGRMEVKLRGADIDSLRRKFLECFSFGLRRLPFGALGHLTSRHTGHTCEEFRPGV